MQPIKKVGLLCGREYSFPPAFIAKVNQLGKGVGVAAEFVKLGGTKMNEPAEYSVIGSRATRASTAPLRVWSYIGFVIAAIALLYALFLIGRVVLYGIDVAGYASMMVAVLFLGGVQLLSLGILGEYVGRILVETKRRPIYIVREKIGDTGDDDD